MADSLQKWVGRNRPPRVQITYDVEIGDAIEKKELPFVVGLMSDLSGDPAEPRGGAPHPPTGYIYCIWSSRGDTACHHVPNH